MSRYVYVALYFNSYINDVLSHAIKVALLWMTLVSGHNVASASDIALWRPEPKSLRKVWACQTLLQPG
jgi:hypothetical protein